MMTEEDRPIIYGVASFGPAQASDGRWYSLNDIKRVRHKLYSLGLLPTKQWKRINAIKAQSCLKKP